MGEPIFELATEVSKPRRRQSGPAERRIWLGASRDDYRVCIRCRLEKPLDAFYRHGSRYLLFCRACKAKEAKEYRATLTPERRRRQLWGMVAWRFGLKRKDLEAQWESQQGRCAICGVEMERGRGPRAVNLDHDQKTHKPRGLTCHVCNINVMRFERIEALSPDYRAGLFAYLANPPWAGPDVDIRIAQQRANRNNGEWTRRQRKRGDAPESLKVEADPV